MRKLLLIVFIGFVIGKANVFAQTTCTSLRYQDTIFHSVVDTTDIYFGSAIPYGSTTPQDLYLDIYQPANDTLKNRPLIVYQFGGGFVIGWREEPDIPQFATYFAQLGYVVATIDYRLEFNPTDTTSGVRECYRASQDERSAVRFLSQNAKQFGIDTSRIILTGSSAGCFTAFVNCFMGDTLRPACTYGTPLEPTDLGCMDCSGNTDLGHHIPQVLAIVNMWGAILDTNYIQITKNVPTITFQGDEDVIVPYTTGYPFQLPIFPVVYGAVPINARMQTVGIRHELHTFVGYGHEPELTAPWLNDTIYNYSRRFLWPLLKPQTSAITGDSVVCKNALAIYSVVNTAGSQYCWQITGNGNVVSNTNNSIGVIWSDTGNVLVSVTELNDIDAQGNTESFNTQVISHSQPAFTDSSSQLQVSFANTSSGINNNYWSFGNSDTSTAANPVENYASPGTYTIKLYTSNGFCVDSVSKTVTIDSCPLAHFTVQVNNLNCVFAAGTTNTASYSWNFGDGDSASVSNTNVFHAYQQAGTYVVTLKVVSSLGCTEVDTVSITTNQPTAIGNLSTANTTIVCDNAEGCKIDLGNNGITATVEVFDVTGRKVFEQNIQGNYVLETSSFAPGIYLLKVSGESSVVVKKILKQ